MEDTVYSKSDLANKAELVDLMAVMKKGDFDLIYRPCDDTFLMIDTLFAEMDLISQFKPTFVAEIGYEAVTKNGVGVCAQQL